MCRILSSIANADKVDGRELVVGVRAAFRYAEHGLGLGSARLEWTLKGWDRLVPTKLRPPPPMRPPWLI